MKTAKPSITVFGFLVTPEIEAVCITRMRSSWFTAANITDCARVIIPWGKYDVHAVAYRLADRLIQRERKAGNIERNRNGWIWQK